MEKTNLFQGKNPNKKTATRAVAGPGHELQYDTLKLRLYPTDEQKRLIEKTFVSCRWIWNHMLNDQQRFYWETDAHFIPTPAKYKTEAPFLKEVDNQALTQEYNSLAQAFRNFFRNPQHYQPPKFKQAGRDRDSYTVCNCHSPSGSTIYLTREGIRMTKLGVVSAKFSRRPQSGWELKRVTVSKTKSGDYYAALLYGHSVKIPEPVIPQKENTVGLKFSLRHFYVADNGNRADPPHWLAESQAKLERIQKKLNAMEPGSKNYEEQVQKYRKLHEHIANQRRDFLHKESARLAREQDAVSVRMDNLTDQTGAVTHGSLQQTGYGEFRKMLQYKLERQGKRLLEADQYAPTTRTCHCCGNVLAEMPDPRRKTWICPQCGAKLDREQNAAINIKTNGLAKAKSL